MKIAFVCTGNTCRSCMAEAIFNKEANLHGISSISAGTHVYPGSITSVNSAKVVKNNLAIDISTRVAVQLTKEIIEDVDIVLTMTENIKDILLYNFPQRHESIFTLCEYAGLGVDILDPYGMNLERYEATFEQIENAIKLIINKLSMKG